MGFGGKRRKAKSARRGAYPAAQWGRRLFEAQTMWRRYTYSNVEIRVNGMLFTNLTSISWGTL